MNNTIFDNTYFITYSNNFEIDNKTFAFRKQILFDITTTPIKLHLKENSGSEGYWINRSWFTLSKIQTLIKKVEINVDVSHLQWNKQIQLDYVFNL